MRSGWRAIGVVVRSVRSPPRRQVTSAEIRSITPMAKPAWLSVRPHSSGERTLRGGVVDLREILRRTAQSILRGLIKVLSDFARDFIQGRATPASRASRGALPFQGSD